MSLVTTPVKPRPVFVLHVTRNCSVSRCLFSTIVVKSVAPTRSLGSEQILMAPTTRFQIWKVPLQTKKRMMLGASKKDDDDGDGGPGVDLTLFEALCKIT